MHDYRFPTRRHMLGALAATGGGVLVPGRLWASQVVAPGGLDAALAGAAAGTVLHLSPGDHGALVLRGAVGRPGAPLVLTAADPGRPPRLSRMDVRDTAHLVLEGLDFDYAFVSGDVPHIRPFDIQGVRDLTLRDCIFRSDGASGLGPAIDGFGWGNGLHLTGIEGAAIAGCEFRTFHRAIVMMRCRDVEVSQNNIHDIRSDGINLVQVQGILIEGNHIHDFRTSMATGDHPDMIQAWTANTTAPTTDVTIRGNLLSSGQGPWTQTIFLGNEVVRGGQAGREMFFRNILIEENVIANAHLHGITIAETDGLAIRRNTVLRNPRSEGAEDNPPLWTPRINVNPPSRDVEITRNVVDSIGGHEGQPDWRVADNMPVQDRTRIEAGFFGLLFEGDPADPATLRHKPGGPLDGAGIGAAVLQRG